MIIKYKGKIKLELPMIDFWPLKDDWLEDQYVYHMSLERTFYFYMNAAIDPICIQYYGNNFKKYGFAKWIVHPGINRAIGSILRNPELSIDCIIASENELIEIPDCLSIDAEFSRNLELNLSTANYNWHNIREYLTAETSRDNIPGHNHWIVEAHEYTRSFMGGNKVIINTTKGSITMNDTGSIVKEYFVEPGNFIETIKKVFEEIKLLS